MENEFENTSGQFMSVVNTEHIKVFKESPSLNRFNLSDEEDKAFQLFNYFTCGIIKEKIFMPMI